MSRRRISFFVHDLAANPIVRAAALATAVARDCEVEVLGFLHGESDVYEPYRHLFAYKTIRVPLDTLSVIRAIPSLASLATGDVIYACKPLVTSLGPALYAARRLARRPLLLDVEDDEWVTLRDRWPAFLWRDVLKGWRHATAWKFTRALHALVACVEGVTVSTHRLQKRYGGVIVRHGPAGNGFDPDRADLRDRTSCRRRWNLPAEAPLALFAGVPQPHKGWPTLLEALAQPGARPWHLVLAGPPDHHDFAAAAAALGPRCHIIGAQAHELMPLLLAGVDAVPVPQADVPFARSQLPAKAVEAMAMARAVIATRVGDLPEILGEGTRGWLIPPGDAGALAGAFDEIARNQDAARKRGRAARTWYLDEASPPAIAARVRSVIDSVDGRVAALARTEAV
jgi:glycosyltransferase involved in cell wall biosynthesis